MGTRARTHTLSLEMEATPQSLSMVDRMKKLTSFFDSKQSTFTPQTTEHYEIDQNEQKEIDMCMDIGLEQFVTVSCRAIDEIMQLNHQSIGRFRNSKYFASFNESVNLKELLAKRRSNPNPVKSKSVP